MPPGVDYRTADGKDAPVLHVELMNTPVYGDGEMIQDHVYTYTRSRPNGRRSWSARHDPDPDRRFRPVEPRPPLTPTPTSGSEYYRKTGMLFKRFENLEPYFKQRRSGTSLHARNVPIFDHVADNAFVIADSNHGFKMIGVGKLTADMLITGEPWTPFA